MSNVQIPNPHAQVPHAPLHPACGRSEGSHHGACGFGILRFVCLSLLTLCLFLGSISFVHSQISTPPSPHRSPAPPPPPVPRTVPAAIEPELLKAALTSPGGYFRYIVYLRAQPNLAEVSRLSARPARLQAIVELLQTTANVSQAALQAELVTRQGKNQVRRFTPFWVVNAIAVESDADTLFSIAGRPEVDIVRPDRKRELDNKSQIPMNKFQIPNPKSQSGPPLLGFGQWDWGFDSVEWNIARIGADKVWRALGVDGKGVVVASMDTGVDWRHPALEARYRGYNPKGLPQHRGNWASTTDEEYLYPGDGNGHGTHTTGIMVGEGGIGVAPGAQWIAVKVFHDQGYTYDSWLHAGFQWLLAPDGQPGLAPNVVNASWGTEVSRDTTFQPDLAALRAAGIFTVLAAGNHGSKPGTIASPASLPGAFSVGAVDMDEDIANFSGRGPSPWGQVKPEVVAPGVGIRSSMHGGSYTTWNGTSMAAPHVSGLAALLLQVNPNLSVTETAQVITQTAISRGGTRPNNIFGWGRIDAYRAVASVARAGLVTGRVTRVGDGRPLPGATILAGEPSEPTTPLAVTDADGFYTLTLRTATYDITAQAFAFIPRTATRVQVTAGAVRRLDFALEIAPVGALFGRVTDATGQVPLAAKLIVLGTPVEVATDPLNGGYSTFLPPGDYQVEARSEGYRVGRVSVTVRLDQGQKQDFALIAAPRILVVDSGAWYFRSQLSYFEQALHDNDYLYSVWRIKDYGNGAPTVADLLPYDVTIWSSPLDAPGLVGATGTLTQYLSAGGRLFITGQDIGFWDGGGAGASQSYYRDFLKARFVKDDAGTRKVVGSEAEVFSGMQLTLEGRGGADNQTTPDAIAPADALQATPVLRYSTGEIAGLRIGVCQPYRAVYLAFGLEGIDNRPARAEVLGRTIEWLTAPMPATHFDLNLVYPARLSGSPPVVVGAPGQSLTYTLLLRNLGQTTDTYTASVTSPAWPASLWTSDFRQPLTPTLTLSTCTISTLGLRVDVPPDATWNVSATSIVTVTSQLLSASHQLSTRAVMVRTKAPAPILLVDDDRWYDVEEYYQAPLRSLGYPFDTWTVGWNSTEADGSPNEDRLGMYPMVVWFTGYDWAQTLDPVEEQRLARYLDNGGRLFLSAQDYLFTARLTGFGVNYLGILTYTEDYSSTSVTGVPGSPIADGLGPYHLAIPYGMLKDSGNHSDGLTPMPNARAAFVGQEGQVAGVTLDTPAHTFRTAFFAFPFEALPQTGATEVASKLIPWLSPLGASSLSVDRTNVAGGQQITYTIVLRNDGPRPARRVLLVNPLPVSTTLVTGTLSGGAVFDATRNQVIWQGDLPSQQAFSLSYRLALPESVAPGTQVVNQFTLEDSTHIPVRRVVVSRVNVPDLSASTMWVSRLSAHQGDILDYLIILRNVGSLDASSVVMTDTLPAGADLVPESLYASNGQVEVHDQRTLMWTGSVPLRPAQVAISYRLRVRADFPGGFLVNRAVFDDGFGGRTELTSSLLVPTHVYLPLLPFGPR